MEHHQQMTIRRRYILITATLCFVYFIRICQGEGNVTKTRALNADEFANENHWLNDLNFVDQSTADDENESSDYHSVARRYYRTKQNTKTRQQQNGCASFPKYRSADGRCNNFRNPSAGSTSTVYQRIAPANYADGRSVIRRSITGRDLPSARLISTTVFTNRNVPPESEATLMVMSFGQFFQHDLTHIVNARGGADCCSGPLFGTRTQPPPHAECLPIEIPRNDRLYNAIPNQRAVINCLRFVRSQFRLSNNGVREAINVQTHWMDLSHVYGKSQEQSKKLRAGFRGLIATSTVASMPSRKFMKQVCCDETERKCCSGSPCACFETGDDRANFNGPNLQMLHTIWLREHNRVAEQLVRLVPGRTDEFYYQEARRIVIAEYQHITFTEFLPVLIGVKITGRIMKNRVYQQNANPAIFTEWSTAAMRVGHSMINTFMRVFESNGRLSSQSFTVGDQINAFTQFIPNRILTEPTFMDNLIRGMLRTHNERADNHFTAFITGQLFKSPPGPGLRLGLDLAAINIQRGRDHGLPTYAYFWAETQRQFGRNVRLHNFDSLQSTTAPDVIASLRSVYASVNDIDLFVGGTSEKPLPGSLVGPTFTYIITKQLENIKISDPFFYDLQNGPFTKNQLYEIQKASLSRILCDNSDGTISSIQPNVFKIPKGINQPVACNRLASLNLRVFTK